jgi:hypothetical protein
MNQHSAILFDRGQFVGWSLRRPLAISDGFRFGRKDRNQRRDRPPENRS